jgi:hypothetical protein
VVILRQSSNKTSFRQSSKGQVMVESIPYGLIEISLALLVRASFKAL